METMLLSFEVDYGWVFEMSFDEFHSFERATCTAVYGSIFKLPIILNDAILIEKLFDNPSIFPVGDRVVDSISSIEI